jgi:hypothetical protein
MLSPSMLRQEPRQREQQGLLQVLRQGLLQVRLR